MVIVNITASKRRFGESGRIYFVRRVIVNITVSRRNIILILLYQ